MSAVSSSHASGRAIQAPVFMEVELPQPQIQEEKSFEAPSAPPAIVNAQALELSNRATKLDVETLYLTILTLWSDHPGKNAKQIGEELSISHDFLTTLRTSGLEPSQKALTSYMRGLSIDHRVINQYVQVINRAYINSLLNSPLKDVAADLHQNIKSYLNPGLYSGAVQNGKKALVLTSDQNLPLEEALQVVKAAKGELTKLINLRSFIDGERGKELSYLITYSGQFSRARVKYIPFRSHLLSMFRQHSIFSLNQRLTERMLDLSARILRCRVPLVKSDREQLIDVEAEAIWRAGSTIFEIAFFNTLYAPKRIPIPRELGTILVETFSPHGYPTIEALRESESLSAFFLTEDGRRALGTVWDRYASEERFSRVDQSTVVSIFIKGDRNFPELKLKLGSLHQFQDTNELKEMRKDVIVRAFTSSFRSPITFEGIKRWCQSQPL